MKVNQANVFTRLNLLLEDIARTIRNPTEQELRDTIYRLEIAIQDKVISETQKDFALCLLMTNQP